MKRLAITFFMLLCSTAAFASDPCCGIKSMDLKTGVVKASPFAPVDGARVFEFTVTNATLLRSLKAGDAINADFATNFVTLKSGQRFPLRLAPSTPCCSIKSINLKTGLVGFAPVDGARVFAFTVTNATLLRSLKAGDAINADFVTNFVTLKGGERFPLRLAQNR